MESTWQQGLEIKSKRPALNTTLSVDVLVIGAGITGITTAYLLSKTKQKVALIEKASLHENSATAFTTAFITQVIDTDLQKIVDTFGESRAKLVWEAGDKAIDFIEKTVDEEKIECEFTRCSNFEYAINDSEKEELIKEAKLAKNLGFNVYFHDKNDLNFPNAGYLETKKQAKFHPIKYLNGLVEVSEKNGVQFYENTEAKKINEKGGYIEVETPDSVIAARNVIVATYSPFNHPLEMYFKGGLYTTYMFEVNVPKGLLTQGIYEDSKNPYHYFRIDSKKDFDRIIVGGEDHREDVSVDEEKSFKALEKYLKTILPKTKYKIIRRWTGPILEPIDGLPYIGEYKKDSHVFVTHGFSGTGMTFGTISALVFRDKIEGRKNKWAKLFDASRAPTIKQLIAKGIDYSEEFFGAAVKNTISS